MFTSKSNSFNVKKLVLASVLTALVVVLQSLGQFIHLGPFSISLVLVPIIIGAATCGPKIGGWLGFVFSIVVLITDAAAFLAIDVFGTVLTVILKGTAAGLAAGLVYKLFERKNRYIAILLSAIVCPIVNTGIFLLGCVVFFFEAIESWGLAYGFGNAIEYMFLGLAGGNFIVELIINIVLSPIILRVLNIKDKK